MKAVYYISNSRPWGHVDPALLVQYPVPMIDIEVGSSSCVGGIRRNWSGRLYEK